jgi:ribosome-binding ATPase YchF (GTP1/OBG family)
MTTTVPSLPTTPAELITTVANQLMVHLPYERQAKIVLDPAVERVVAYNEQRMSDLPPITNQTSADAVRKLTAGAKKDYNAIESARQLIKAPFLEICNQIDKAAAAPKERLQAVIDECKNQTRDWIAAEEARRAKEEEQRRAAEVVATKASSRPTPAIIAPVLHETIDAALTTRSEVEITNYEEIPPEYWIVDMQKLRYDLLTLKKTVPGARVVVGQDVVARP